MTTEDVVIIGAGPVGLLLAAELRLGGVQPVVLERLPEISRVPKGNGLVGQIVPMLDLRGLTEPCRAEGTWSGPVPTFMFGAQDLDFSRLGVSPLTVLAIPQRRLESVLEERLREMGGSVRRGHELVAFADAGDAVTLDVRGPDGEYGLRARYLVGCDGAHSRVRKQAGIGFPGVTSGEISRIGRVTLPAELIAPGTGEVRVPGAEPLRPATQTRTPRGAISIMPLAALDQTALPGVYIVSTTENPSAGRESGEGDQFDPAEPLTLAELSQSVARVIGAQLPMSRPLWLTRTVGNSRQADRYQVGRILLAGDAAHLFGIGGSLNVGLQDALNLGWKLAADVRGPASAGLVPTYQSERHAAGQRALMSTRAQRLLGGPGEEAAAARTLLGELARYPEPLRHLGELIQGSDIRCPTGPAGRPAHRLQGFPAPDIRIQTADGPLRTAELMRAARPVLLDLGGPVRALTPACVAARWHGRVTVVEGRQIGGQPAAGAMLIRPDGYVAWATDPAEANETSDTGTAWAEELHAALEFWFGAPAQTRK